MHDKKLFGNEAHNLQATLSRVIQESYAESNCSMDATYQLAREKLDDMRRFDTFDKERLIAKAREAGSCGAQIDWTDPWLRGGSKRPLSR